MKKINVAVLTQDESFVIPKNIELLSSESRVNVVSVVKINSKGSLQNKKFFFLRGFGFFQTSKMALLVFSNKFLDIIDSVFFYKLKFLKSLKSSAKILGAKFHIVDNPNRKSFIDKLKKENIDLIVSYSAPCIFENELLKLPKYGCINLHCSLLPKFAGLLPSFWTLYEESEYIGATVHMMDDKIDNGAILAQEKMICPKGITMFSAINLTKKMGGKIMLETITKIIDREANLTSNKVNEALYKTWPTVEQIQQFRQKGGRLI